MFSGLLTPLTPLTPANAWNSREAAERSVHQPPSGKRQAAWVGSRALLEGPLIDTEDRQAVKMRTQRRYAGTGLASRSR
jgi:hypothetical protein